MAMDPRAAQSFEILEAFYFFDRNGDGSITPEELRTVIGPLGGQEITDQELGDVIREVDANGNGTIELDEFSNVLAWKIVESDIEYIREVFKHFDKDQNGFITASELMHMMMTLGEKMTFEDILLMIKEVDTDGDGQVNFTEFARMMMTACNTYIN